MLSGGEKQRVAVSNGYLMFHFCYFPVTVSP